MQVGIYRDVRREAIEAALALPDDAPNASGIKTSARRLLDNEERALCPEVILDVANRAHAEYLVAQMTKKRGIPSDIFASA